VPINEAMFVPLTSLIPKVWERGFACVDRRARGLSRVPIPQKLHIRIQGTEFRVQGSGFRVQGSGFRIQDSGDDPES